MSYVMDHFGLDPERLADCARNDHVEPTIAQVINRFATYGSVRDRPARMFSPHDALDALKEIERGLADWISAHDSDRLGLNASRVLDRAINEVGDLIDGVNHG